MKLYICEICGEISMKFYAVFRGIILCSKRLTISLDVLQLIQLKTPALTRKGTAGFSL
ncbi:MAG: hypothetical protein UR78_C0012G0022 [Candidatus Moranbacteria bacterium GW2011_GWF2_35_39]|nr:MAG: hypothetical protein UR78_C0012G0022 [Candidatus Moranbacteria bacterium GW2011_GWF2_35_39]